MKLGIFYSNPRFEEKALFTAAEANKNIELIKIRDTDLIFDLSEKSILSECDAVLLRSVSQTKNFYAAQYLEIYEKKSINNANTITICNDKFLTSLKLTKANIPTPKTRACFDLTTAFQAIEELGYPVVLKPAVGSWGRLLAKISDRDAAEALLEHKKILGGIHHGNLFYIQEFIEKTESRDIRVLIAGQEIISAIYRTSEHWITNTARGAIAESCEVSPEIKKLALKAMRAVAGDEFSLLGIDLIETKQGLKVVEVNSGVEFHGLSKTVEKNIAEEILKIMTNYKL
jgi:[lysine-biosynthesis-protein LysW]---L-2-aminoadipate ligase